MHELKVRPAEKLNEHFYLIKSLKLPRSRLLRIHYLPSKKCCDNDANLIISDHQLFFILTQNFEEFLINVKR